METSSVGEEAGMVQKFVMPNLPQVPLQLHQLPSDMLTNKKDVSKVKPKPISYYDLPNGWKKRVVQRLSGVSVGKFDVYLHSPDGIKLRSNKEILSYLKNYPDKWDTFDPHHYNMDNPGMPQSQNTKRLIELVAKLKETGKFPEESATSDLPTLEKGNKKFFSRRKRKHDGGVEVERRESSSKKCSKNDNNNRHGVITREYAVQLEKHFLENVCVPTPQQVQKWSTQLGLDSMAVSQWFRNKWRGKLEYEARAATEWHELNSTRQIRKFDIQVSYDPYSDGPDDEEFVIENENAEEDFPL